MLVGPDSLLCFQLTCRIEPACTKKLYATNTIPTHTFLLREVFSTVASLLHTLVAFIVPSKKCSSVFPYNNFFLCSYETPSSFIKQQQARTSHWCRCVKVLVSQTYSTENLTKTLIEDSCWKSFDEIITDLTMKEKDKIKHIKSDFFAEGRQNIQHKWRIIRNTFFFMHWINLNFFLMEWWAYLTDTLFFIASNSSSTTSRIFLNSRNFKESHFCITLCLITHLFVYFVMCL